MNNFSTKFLLLSLSLLLLSGCITENITEKVKTRKKADSLESTLYKYANAIRWGYFDEAYAYRKYEKGEYPKPPDNLADIRVTSYDVIHPATMMVEDVAVQLVEINYYLIAYQTLKTLRDRQVWIYDEEASRWFLDSPMPEFK